MTTVTLVVISLNVSAVAFILALILDVYATLHCKDCERLKKCKFAKLITNKREQGERLAPTKICKLPILRNIPSEYKYCVDRHHRELCDKEYCNNSYLHRKDIRCPFIEEQIIEKPGVREPSGNPIKIMRSTNSPCPVCGEGRLTKDIHHGRITFVCGYSHTVHVKRTHDNKQFVVILTPCQKKYFREYIQESIWEGI